jgi:hypothetical protein
MAGAVSEKKIAESNLILLMQIVKAGADVDALIRRGLRYSQVSYIIDKCTQKGYLTEKNNKLFLTPKGKEKLLESSKIGDSPWISPEEESRYPKSDKFDIYLPKDTAFFD